MTEGIQTCFGWNELVRSIAMPNDYITKRRVVDGVVRIASSYNRTNIAQNLSVAHRTARIFYADISPSLVEKAVTALGQIFLQASLGKSVHDPVNEVFEVGHIFTEHHPVLGISIL